MGKRFREFALPAVVINEQLEMIDASEEYIEKYGWKRTFLSNVDSGSQSKVAKFIGKLKVGEPLEVSLVGKSGNLEFVDLFVTWSRGEGVVLVVQKSSQYSLVSSKLGLLQTELSIRNSELVEEKDRVQSLLVGMQELSAPAIVVKEGVTLIPLFGALELNQMTLIFNRLLTHFVEEQTQIAILDFTASGDFGLENWQGVDQFVKSASIMGVRVIVSGLHPKQVKALNELEIQIGSTHYYAKLAAALQSI
ncbi:STAS domain-containing protein [Chryseomicrobium sp. FSL W7-1435]|uniref:STAS domain-containing protein n=1 Tax=Chryseomicrobium sp. FSL W7-1435 TaxID=2921704 RepID=UPI00315A6141